MDVERVIRSSGLASIGAWRTVIEDVAVATVQSLKEEMAKQKNVKEEQAPLASTKTSNRPSTANLP